MREITDPPADRRGTVAAVVDTPYGAMIVYGTVIPWANESNFDDGSPAKTWQVNLAGIERQRSEWVRLRERFPATPMVVAGDVNQDRDGSSWYGSTETRKWLTGALERAGLVCITEMDAVAEGTLREHHLIDHICVTPDLIEGAVVSCFENTDDEGQRLSDHPTVIAELTLA